MKRAWNKAALEKIKKIRQQDRMYGTATIGERGQVVIPAEARKELDLQPGDQLVVVGNKFGKMLTFMKADNLGEFMEMVLNQMAGTGLEDEIMERFKLLSTYISKNKQEKL